MLRFAIVAVCLVVSASACSRSESTADYFTDLQAVTDELSSELDAVEGEFNAGLLGINFESPTADSELIDLFQTSMNSVAASFATLVEGLRALDPPSEVEVPHQQAFDAGKAVLDDYEARADQLGAIATRADLDSYAQAIAASAARSQFTTTCLALQAEADTRQLEVDLNC